MKKTLIITLEYPPTIGGVANYVHSFAGELPNESVVVLAPFYSGKPILRNTPKQEEKLWDEQVNYKLYRKSLFHYSSLGD